MYIKFIRKLSDIMPLWVLRLCINLWAPYRGAGIKVVTGTKDFSYIQVKLKRKWNNRNYVGTHFGGSIYAMTDPFFMFLLIKNLGTDYIVWDKSASIEYLKPGTTDLYAEFRITPEEVTEIKAIVDKEIRYDVERSVSVYDTEKNEIARINKVIYIRKKQPKSN